MHDRTSYILLGPPASGKSTQAEVLENMLGLVHIDIGAELREAAKTDTPLGKAIDETINVKHELATDEAMSIVLKEAIARVPEEKGILLNGAPRRASQIDEVVKDLEASGRIVKNVVFIQLSEDEAVKRISKRFQCRECQKPYILGVDLPEDKQCVICGGVIEQRKDDTEEGVKKRFTIFHSDTLPVIEHFRQAGKLVIVDGNKEITEISKEMLEKLEIEA